MAYFQVLPLVSGRVKKNCIRFYPSDADPDLEIDLEEREGVVATVLKFPCVNSLNGRLNHSMVVDAGSPKRW